MELVTCQIRKTEYFLKNRFTAGYILSRLLWQPFFLLHLSEHPDGSYNVPVTFNQQLNFVRPTSKYFFFRIFLRLSFQPFTSGYPTKLCCALFDLSACAECSEQLIIIDLKATILFSEDHRFTSFISRTIFLFLFITTPQNNLQFGP